jgi:probable HAF family extracellular repeat protein
MNHLFTMNHLFKHRRLIYGVYSIAIIICLALGVSKGLATEFARTAYAVTDLGVLPGKKMSIPAAINNQGQVTGTSSLGNSTSDAAFRYDGDNKALERVGSQLAGSLSRGFGINDFGIVVGDSTNFGRSLTVRRAVLLSNGSATDLGTLKQAGSYSRANGINGSTQVVGFAGPELDSNKSRAFIWSKADGMQDLGTLGGEYAQAFAINDSGFVTGNSQTPKGSLADGTHAFLYLPNSKVINPMCDLGTLGGNSSYGMFISPKNHVVGYSTINNTDNRVHAFLYDETGMHDLGSLTGGNSRSDIDDQSVALGINTSDEVVGYSYVPAQGNSPVRASIQGQQVAFIYSRGVMTDLNTLIGPAAKRYSLHSARAINDNGQIAATAFSKEEGAFHAVLLTPTITSK